MDPQKKITIFVDQILNELIIDLQGIPNKYEALGMIKIAMLNLESVITNQTIDG